MRNQTCESQTPLKHPFSQLGHVNIKNTALDQRDHSFQCCNKSCIRPSLIFKSMQLTFHIQIHASFRS